MKQALFLALSLSIGLSAFPAMAETTAEENLEKAGQTIDESVDRAEEAVEETVEETKEVIDEVGDKVEDTVERVEDKVEDLNDSERAKQLETMEKLEKRVDTPVGIGRDGSDLLAGLTAQPVEIDFQPFGRPAAGGIEHMGGEACHRLGSGIR